MAQVFPRPGESIDSLLKRFKRLVDQDGILSDLKKYEYYEKPSVTKRRKKNEAKKIAHKKQILHDKYGNGKNINFKFSKDKSIKILTINKNKSYNQYRKPQV